MLNKHEIEAINKGWRSIHIIWIAMLIALFVYLVVGLSLKDIFQSSIQESSLKILRYILYAISFVTFFSIKYVRRLILKSKNIGLSQVIGVNSPAVVRYITATIVSLAMAESISIYGLVLFLLGKNTTDLYLLIFISAVAMIYYRPFKEQMIKLVNEMKEF